MTESTSPAAREAPALTPAQKLTYSLPSLALNLTGALFGAWLLYYYRPPADDTAGATRVALVSAAAWGIASVGGRVWDAIVDPPVGYWSDRCRARMGRRLPFILWGTPFYALTFAALWFPPFAPGSLGNDVYAVLMMFAYWTAFTVVIAPYMSLLPEIAPGDHERVVLSSVMAIMTVLGSALGPALPEILSGQNGGAPGFMAGVVTNEFQAAGLVGGVFLLVLCLAPLLNVRERPFSAEKEVPPGMIKAIRSAYENAAFRTYVALVALLQMGLNIVIAVIPFLVSSVLERGPSTAQRIVEVLAPDWLRSHVLGELPALPGVVPYGNAKAWVGILLAIVMVGAALMFPIVNLIHKRVRKKPMFLFAGFTFAALLVVIAVVLPLFPDPTIPAIVIFALMTLPVSIALVLPMAIFADVVDWDAARVGYRREGIFNGATAFVTKAAIGLATGAAGFLLLLGDSRANPRGIYVALFIAAGLIAAGTLLFRRHPIDK